MIEDSLLRKLDSRMSMLIILAVVNCESGRDMTFSELNALSDLMRTNIAYVIPHRLNHPLCDVA
jgi:hypothetical protein